MRSNKARSASHQYAHWNLPSRLLHNNQLRHRMVRCRNISKGLIRGKLLTFYCSPAAAVLLPPLPQ
jgi:hypothetical protein